MQKSVGVLGGTFNPVHIGHLAVADSAIREFGLQKVVFLPNGNPPHKQDKKIISANHRYNMVSLAIQNNPMFDISDYEIKRDKPSYTIDTQRVLRSLYDCKLYFIIGADSLYTLEQWKSYNTLIKECSFIVADRNCKEGSDIIAECEKLRSLGCDIHTLNMNCVDITSTKIRQMVSQRKDIKDYVPENVLTYIYDNNLYSDI